MKVIALLALLLSIAAHVLLFVDSAPPTEPLRTDTEPAVSCKKLSPDILQMGTIEAMEEVQSYDRFADGLRRVAEGASAQSIERWLDSLKPHPESQRVILCQGRALSIEGRWQQIIFYLDVPQQGPSVLAYQEL